VKAFEDFLSRHDRVMLQFSAGKDSAVTLELLKPYLDKIDVVWCNPGNPYPETLEYMERIAKAVPHFKCVLGSQPQSVAFSGWPVDVVPLDHTAKGNALAGEATIRLRPFWECCEANMWKPMQDEVIRGGYSGVIRGQKEVDRLKNPLPSGTVVEGVEYFYPIDDWTEGQVVEFLNTYDLWPESYKRGLKASLDCMTCTAYCRDTPGRLKDLRHIDIEAWRRVAGVHLALSDALQDQKTWLENCYA